MNEIFNFIFKCFSKLFNLLDVTFPNSNLTFLDFFLLVLIIPLIFKLVRGAVVNSGTDVIFNSLGSVSDIHNDSKKISYSNYVKNRELTDSYRERYKNGER